jgi:NADH-quinone oxidoreductase subunit J
MNTAFIILSGITVIGALMAVSLRNLVHCVLSLILFFLGIAGHYFLLRAEFLGIVQILIYIGAVAILILFAVMLTRNVTGTETPEQSLGRKWWVGVSTAILLAAVVISGIWKDGTVDTASKAPEPIGVARIGEELVADWVVPFEVMAVLLTAALIGAVVIALEELKRGGDK